MRVHRMSLPAPASRLQPRVTKHAVAPRPPARQLLRPLTVCSGVAESSGRGSRADTFHSAIRVPTVMASPLGGSGSGSGAGATMERSKLSLKQTIQQTGPKLADAGGGGGIGKGVVNGGDGGGGDDDDDDYFNEGEGEDDDDESRWWHRVPLTALYDAATVRAVLSEWCLTVERLPGFLQMLASMQYYSTAQWVRYLTFQERPNLFRAVERSLARFPDARSGFVGRMLADPAFVQKTALEGGVAFAVALAHEAHVRGKRISSEWDFALVNAMCIAAGAAVCGALVAPSKTPTPPSAKFPWQGMLNKLPNNAFEKNTPARSFEVPQRVSGFVAKGVELSAVNAIAGGASAALQHCIVLARQSKNAKYKPVTPVPGISRAAGGMGVYGGLAANSRLQAAAGLDRVLLEYAKVSTKWQVMGLSSAFRAVSQFAIENPWGWGPPPVTACSRPALQGTPTSHVRTPVKRKLSAAAKKRRAAALAARAKAGANAPAAEAVESPMPAPAPA